LYGKLRNGTSLSSGCAAKEVSGFVSIHHPRHMIGGDYLLMRLFAKKYLDPA
jgi:hypothetical protein